MDINYRFTEKAKKDISDSAVWYEEQQRGVGAEFLTEVNEKVIKIAARPNSYAIIDGDTRRASLMKFPFFIYYIIKEPIRVDYSGLA